jgi:DNA-binding response OmpR family regulator
VEDEKEIAEVVRTVLQREHHQVDWAPNGKEALTCLETETYDAIITDVQMPLLSGVRLHQVIAGRWPGLAKRIIFMTGDTIGGDTQRFLQQTDALYLTKPFTIEDLLRTIHRALTMC